MTRALLLLALAIVALAAPFFVYPVLLMTVLIVAQPTWGVDVGAAAFIRQALIDLRDRGCAVLVISEELDELFEICDRIAVIAKGRLSPTRPTSATTVEDIGVWMSGLWPGAELAPASQAHPLPGRAESLHA